MRRSCALSLVGLNPKASKILNGEGSIHQSGTQFFSMCSLYMLAMLIHFSESDVELSS